MSTQHAWARALQGLRRELRGRIDGLSRDFLPGGAGGRPLLARRGQFFVLRLESGFDETSHVFEATVHIHSQSGESCIQVREPAVIDQDADQNQEARHSDAEGELDVFAGH